ncbi:MAG: O-antigen ligase family protein [Candidatus Moraniibacteriota bacterium]
MDIHITSFPIQLGILVFLLFFLVLSYKKPAFAALLFPIILPFYLVKIYLGSDIVTCYMLHVTCSPTIPTNLLEILLIIFLLANLKLIWRGIKTFLPNSFVIPAPCQSTGSTPAGIQKKSIEMYFSALVQVSLPRRQAGALNQRILQLQKKLSVISYQLSVRMIFFYSVVLLLLSSIVSTLFAINHRAALGAAKSWFFLPVLLFFALLPLLQSAKFRHKFLYSIAFSGVVITIINLPFVLANIYTYDGRLTGLYLSPNHLAMALVPGIIALALLLSSAFLSSSRKRGSREILIVLLFALELLTLYFTSSYGTWAGLLIPLLILFVIPSASRICHPERSRGIPLKKDSIRPAVLTSSQYSIFRGIPPLRSLAATFGRNDNKKQLYVKLLLVILLFGLLALSQASNPKLSHIINGDYYSSLHSRLMIWQSALAISRDHWLFGIGAGNFQQAYLDYQSRFPEPYIEWAVPQPHNIFLAFLTQLGIVGLVSFIFILILTLFRIVIPSESQGRVEGSLKQTERDSSTSLRSVRNDNKNKRLGFSHWDFIGNWKLGFGNLKNKIDRLDTLSLWAFVYLVYILIHGLADTPYFKNDLAILFWLALAAIWTAKSPKSTRITGYESPDK